MARGWESKSVEMQMEDRRAPERQGPNNSPDAAQQRELELLKLSGKRLQSELASMDNERLRELKHRALSHIEKRIHILERSRASSGQD